jgi:hypothetical protein
LNISSSSEDCFTGGNLNKFPVLCQNSDSVQRQLEEQSRMLIELVLEREEFGKGEDHIWSFLLPVPVVSEC